MILILSFLVSLMIVYSRNVEMFYVWKSNYRTKVIASYYLSTMPNHDMEAVRKLIAGEHRHLLDLLNF